jgi:ribosome maturation factor RimP
LLGWFLGSPLFFIRGFLMELDVSRTGVEAKFFELCEKVVPELGYRLYDMEYIKGQSLLRVYIMDEKTKSAVIEDCIQVDRALTPYIDEENWIPEELVLEVSSPGINRSLKTMAHFEESLNEQVKVTTRADLPAEGNADITEKKLKNRKYQGNLLEVKAEGIKVADKDTDFFIP